MADPMKGCTLAIDTALAAPLPFKPLSAVNKLQSFPNAHFPERIEVSKVVSSECCISLEC